jgi:hypothetical protein
VGGPEAAEGLPVSEGEDKVLCFAADNAHQVQLSLLVLHTKTVRH